MNSFSRVSSFRMMLVVLLAAVAAAGALVLAGPVLAQTVLPTSYKVNAGGDDPHATDASDPNNPADEVGEFVPDTPFLADPTNSNIRTLSVEGFNPLACPTANNSFPTATSVPAGTPPDIFKTERFADGESDLKYAFPIANGNYEVRLYFAETFVSNTDTNPEGDPADREFNIAVELEENIVDANFDITDEAESDTPGTTGDGSCLGIARTYQTTVSDESLDLLLLDIGKENPSVRGIEILPVPEGTLAPNPAGLNFGSVEVGKDGTQQVTLTNDGDADVTIQSADITGPDAGEFTTTFSGPQTVTANGGTIQIPVTFAPNSAGTKTATLSVVNDGTTSPVQIPLSGTATAATPPPGVGDTTGPTIKKMKPKKGSETSDRTPLIKARVSDETSDLTASDIRLLVDGKEVKFSYDESTDRLTYTPEDKLSRGKHTVRVEATDEAGNTTIKVRKFKIVE